MFLHIYIHQIMWYKHAQYCKTCSVHTQVRIISTDYQLSNTNKTLQTADVQPWGVTEYK